jgi:hypothetical protein
MECVDSLCVAPKAPKLYHKKETMREFADCRYLLVKQQVEADAWLDMDKGEHGKRQQWTERPHYGL